MVLGIGPKTIQVKKYMGIATVWGLIGKLVSRAWYLNTISDSIR